MLPGDGLTPRGRELLTVLSKRGDWVTRAELATILGKARLTPYTVRLLQTMVAKGVLEMRPYSPKTKILAFEYRVKH